MKRFLVGEKFKYFLTHRFETIASAARAYKVKGPTLYTYISNESMLGGKLLQKTQSFGCDINWLLDPEQGVSQYKVAEQKPSYNVPAPEFTGTDLIDLLQTYSKAETLLDNFDTVEEVVSSIKNTIAFLEQLSNTLNLLTDNKSQEVNQLQKTIAQLKKEIRTIPALAKSIG